MDEREDIRVIQDKHFMLSALIRRLVSVYAVAFNEDGVKAIVQVSHGDLFAGRNCLALPWSEENEKHINAIIDKLRERELDELISLHYYGYKVMLIPSYIKEMKDWLRREL